MKKDKVVLFDIDYTLFDVRRFRYRLYQTIADLLNYNPAHLRKIGKVIFEQVRAQTGYFQPEIFISRLLKSLNRQKEEQLVLKAVFAESNFPHELFYKEVKSVLQELSNGAWLGIFSRGYGLLQRGKLATIAHLLKKEHIHITLNKEQSLPKLLQKYKDRRLYLIDDALGVLYQAKKLDKNIFTIWVRRGRFAKNQKEIAGFAPDAQVFNLKRVVKLVEKN
ncbi:HAD hydrolase-like protein [Candidatus Microgenomates bacterium]|nr:HAD hydrolase-like protein [Candidatus Microgenomates bacterium]